MKLLNNIHPSVKRWTLSFIAVDAAILLFMLGNCAFRPVDCLETFTFIPAFMNMMLIFALSFLGELNVPFPVETTIFFMLSTLIHGLIGAGIGHVLKNKRVHLAISIFAAIVVILALAILQVRLAMLLGAIS